MCGTCVKLTCLVWTENVTADHRDNDDDSAVATPHRLSSWSIPSTSRAAGRGDVVQLGRVVRASSRSASDIHQMTDVLTTGSHGAEMSLRLSGCGAERSVQAKRRVIKVFTLLTDVRPHRRTTYVDAAYC